MASYALYLGGLAGNANHEILPQGSPETIDGYADHQRRRSYAVTRQLDYRARTPGGGIDVNVSQKDYAWYKRLLDSGLDVEVGDFLDIVVCPAFTRIEAAEAKIVIAKEGLSLSLTRRENVGGSPAVADVDFVGAANTPLALNDLGDTVGYGFSTIVPYNPLYVAVVSLEVLAVPGLTAAEGGNLGGFYGIFQVEAVDWGRGDLNGNA